MGEQNAVIIDETVRHIDAQIIFKLLWPTRDSIDCLFFVSTVLLKEKMIGGFRSRKKTIFDTMLFCSSLFVRFFLHRSSIAAINGQSFAIFASHRCATELVKEMNPRCANGHLLANAVKKDTYE